MSPTPPKPRKAPNQVGPTLDTVERDITGLKARIEGLEAQVSALDAELRVFRAERPGRKAIPLVAVNQPGVCAIDPESDDKNCPHASTYRYQQGCRGASCTTVNREYYSGRETAKKPAPPKKATGKAAPPVKKQAAKKK